MIHHRFTCDACDAEIFSGRIEVSIQAPPDGFSFRGMQRLLHFCDRRCLSDHFDEMSKELLIGCTIGRKEKKR